MLALNVYFLLSASLTKQRSGVENGFTFLLSRRFIGWIGACQHYFLCIENSGRMFITHWYNKSQHTVFVYLFNHRGFNGLTLDDHLRYG